MAPTRAERMLNHVHDLGPIGDFRIARAEIYISAFMSLAIYSIAIVREHRRSFAIDIIAVLSEITSTFAEFRGPIYTGMYYV